MAESNHEAVDGPDLESRYRVIRKLGEGASAVVYVAEDLMSKRQVALKVLRRQLSAVVDPRRFSREIALLSTLEHPQIVPILEAGTWDGSPSFSMPYYEAGTLRDLLRREQQLSIDRVVALIADVARALSYAHERGVVHRDLKPDNVLIDGHSALLADFGLARAVEASGTSGLSTSGLALGTPKYMSPEQAAGRPLVDHRSDIYGLGILAYEMLAGEPPFDGPTAQAIAARHIAEPPRSLRLIRPAVPEGLEDAILEALAKAPADRPESPARFVERVRAGASGKRGRRRWSLGFRTGVPLFATAIVLGTVWLGRLRSPDRPAASEPPPNEIAVRPFDDLSAAGDLHHIASGLSSDLTSELALATRLKVRSVSATEQYRGASPDSFARGLRVGTVVEGSVTRSGKQLRVEVRMVGTADGTVLSSRFWDFSPAAVLSVRDSVALVVVRFLGERLGEFIDLESTRATTKSATAWDWYQRFREQLALVPETHRRGDTSATSRAFDSAFVLVNRSIAADSTWTEGRLAKGWLLASRSRLTTDQELAVERAEQAEAVARGLLQGSAPDNPEVLELLGTAITLREMVRMDNPHAAADAEDALRRAAVPTNPNEARAWNSLANLLRLQGRGIEAQLAARKAYAVDPYRVEAVDMVAQICGTAVEVADIKAAAEWCDLGASRFPDEFRFPYFQLRLMTFPMTPTPSVAAALDAHGRMRSASPPSEWHVSEPQWQMLLAGVIARAGLRDSARRMIQASRLAGLARKSPDLDVYEAEAWVAVGVHDSAVARLAEFIRRYPLQRPTIVNDPVFGALRGDKRFMDLITGSDRR